MPPTYQEIANANAAQRRMAAAAREEQTIDARVQQTAVRAAQEHPNIPGEIFMEIAALYRRQHVIARTQGHPLQVDVAPIYSAIVERHGENGKTAFQIMNTEMRPKGLMETALVNGVKLVYDSGHGGLQWGRIAGILGGGFLGLKLMGMVKGIAGGGVIGAVLPIVALAAATILGAKLGNMGQQMVTGSNHPPAPVRQPAGPAVTAGPQRPVGRQVNNHVNDGETLSPASTPRTTAANPPGRPGEQRGTGPVTPG